jgi:diguanylate cyclase (GGDEF)-like protein/PAS domain S-box-containing protein
MSNELSQFVDELPLFRGLVERSSIGLIVFDAQSTILFANPLAQSLCARTLAELTGQQLEGLFVTELSPEAQCERLACLNEGRLWQAETLIQRPDGSSFWADVQLVPVAGRRADAPGFCAFLRDITPQKMAVEKIERLVSFDQLTLLPNRAQFMLDLQRLLEQAGTAGELVLMVYIDVDQLRAVNDSLGHVVADQLLVTVASRLRETSRRQDLLARLSGDEFALVLSGGTDPEILQHAAERLVRGIGQSFVAAGHEVSFSLSAGAALFPADAQGLEELMGSAELALLAAKRESGGAFRRFEAGWGHPGKGRAEAIEALRQAIRNNELVLHYQPQVSLHSGQVVGLEALVRWQHPSRGLLAPAHFIPLAEDSGLVIALGEWVMRCAVRQIRCWADEGLPLVRVAVNLSARHFVQIELPETIDALLAEYGVGASLFELELTENVMMHDAESAIRIVDRLKAIGVRLSLDDFGTGYSSLAYLSRFAIDVIKIDQSFVRDITSNPVNASIAVATIAMAHKLGKTVIAEGVETEGQMIYLRRHECDEMQGYFFSRPVPASQISIMLRQGISQSFGLVHRDEQLTLLVVDDEPHVLSALTRLLRREGYRVLCAQSAAQGLELLSTNLVQVIVSDQRMPFMTGTQFLGRVKQLYPDTIRMVLSGYSELSSLTDAINEGAIYRYLSKPWDDDRLKVEIMLAFRHYREQRLHLTPVAGLDHAPASDRAESA